MPMQEDISHWLESIQSTDFGFLAEKEFQIIGAIALGLLVLLVFLRLRPTRRIRAFKGETGYVEISRHALLELVHSACEQMPEVRKPAIKIRARRKLNLSVRIRVDGSTNLRDTASYLQTHLKDSLENNLGIENLGQIEIIVSGIRSGNSPKVQPSGIDLNQRPSSSSSPTGKYASPPSPPSQRPRPATSSATPAPAPSLTPASQEEKVARPPASTDASETSDSPAARNASPVPDPLGSSPAKPDEESSKRKEDPSSESEFKRPDSSFFDKKKR